MKRHKWQGVEGGGRSSCLRHYDSCVRKSIYDSLLTQKRIHNVERRRTDINIQFIVLYYTSCTLPCQSMSKLRDVKLVLLFHDKSPHHERVHEYFILTFHMTSQSKMFIEIQSRKASKKSLK